MKIPDIHQTVMPYLVLNNAAGFIEFTKKVFNAESLIIHMREDNKTIMHSEVMIGGCTIMFGDTTDNYKATTANLFVYVENADESYALALSNGAVTLNGLSDQEYGRTCGVTDPYGNVWWITSIKQ